MTTMDTQRALKELGLNDQEANIYGILIKTGGLPASLLAKEAGLRRTTAYVIVKSMVQKGFASVFVKKGRQVFVAERPQNIAGYFEKKLNDFTQAIPLFESMEKKQIQTVGLRFIETIDELERFFAGILRQYRGRSYDVMSNGNEWQRLDPEFFVQFRKDRAAQNIKTRLLLTTDSKKTNPKDRSLLRDVKFLPKKYQFKSTILIFDDQILIIGSNQAATAVLVVAPAMVDIFKSMFQILWDVI
jgi:sugar-specific transcriptional regulator TrmB